MHVHVHVGSVWLESRNGGAAFSRDRRRENCGAAGLWLPIGLVAACGTLASVLSHLRTDDRFFHLEEP